MANRPFRRCVEDVGDGIYGHVQPNGRGGWSNAGLVTSRGETPPVNTHANPDRYFGNGTEPITLPDRTLRKMLEDSNTLTLRGRTVAKGCVLTGFADRSGTIKAARGA